jgi:hypothetical protein
MVASDKDSLLEPKEKLDRVLPIGGGSSFAS